MSDQQFAIFLQELTKVRKAFEETTKEIIRLRLTIESKKY